MTLFDDVPSIWKCNKCEWTAKVSQAVAAEHQCEPVDLDIQITQFLNRWTWRQDTAVVRAELEALITEARKS